MGSDPISGPLYNAPLSNVTPFTYRDGETYLEQLKRLRDWISEVTTSLNAAINAVSDADKDANDALAAALNTALGSFQDTVNDTLERLLDQAPAVAYDPTNGQIVAFNLAIGHSYDNTRYYAYFAEQLDNFQYTAAQWDAMQYTARHFDLSLAYSPTHANGDNIVPAPVTPN